MALCDNPGLSFDLLAKRGGVSRRTLYRLAPTREALFDLLRVHAVEATFAALDKARLTERDALTALEDITEDFLADAALYTFWVADTEIRRNDSSEKEKIDEAFERYRTKMMLFFEKGQVEGVFRNDIPASWLLEVYDCLLLAASRCRQTGNVAPNNLKQLVIETFRNGLTQ